MIIRKACVHEYQAVRSFYHSLIDGIADLPYRVGWIKDIYPAPEFLSESIKNGELYIAEKDCEIISAMVLNHECNDGYQNFEWPTKADKSEITVIHALGVHPRCGGMGYAKKMVRFAIDNARENRQKVIRLDVLKENVPAGKLYAGLGFTYLHTLPMYYEDTGWTDFELYEYRL